VIFSLEIPSGSWFDLSFATCKGEILMATFHLTDLGSLRMRAEDRETGAVLNTDAAKSDGGLGENFSPTDLVAVALGQCVLTLLAILAGRMKVDIGHPTAKVTKITSEKPPIRFKKISVAVEIPTEPDEAIRKKLEDGAEHYCPVLAALNPEIEVDVTFHWGVAL
jgi:putative redox protein